MKKEQKLEASLFLIWAVSLTATLGSLFFSEVMNYPPCELCWYQRVFMYPMAILLLVAIVRKDYFVSRYSVFISGTGLTIAIYHNLIQRIPALQENVIGCGAIPCTTDYIDWFGFITIPLLSATAYLIIFGVSIYMIRLTKGDK